MSDYLKMKTLTIVTDKTEPNRSYEIKTVLLDGSKLFLSMEEDEADDFLSEFLLGNSAFPITIDTDTVCIRVKPRVSVESCLISNDSHFVSFSINLSLIN